MCTIILFNCFLIIIIVFFVVCRVDAEKSVTDTSTPVISPDSKAEVLDGDVPTENGNNNVTDDKVTDDKVSLTISSVGRELYTETLLFRVYGFGSKTVLVLRLISVVLYL